MDVEVAGPPHDQATRRRGRDTSSPPQFGQTWSNEAAQAGQNVHSNVQIIAAPAGASAVWQRSHSVFIASATAISWRARSG